MRRKGGEEAEARPGAVGRVPNPADEKGAEESAEVSDRINQGDAGAAAAASPRNDVGKVQKTEMTMHMPEVATVMARREATRCVPTAGGGKKAETAEHPGMVRCHRRSPVRSEWRATVSMAAAATAQGRAVRTPTMKSSATPDDWIRVGSQKLTYRPRQGPK